MSLPLKAGQNPDPLLSPDSLPSSTHASIAFGPLFSVRAEDVRSSNNSQIHSAHPQDHENKSKRERGGIRLVFFF